MHTTTQKIVAGLGLVAFGVAVRFAFHLPDATPLVAIAFVSAVYLGRKWAIILPLVTLFISDLSIGFYDWRVMLSVYGSFALVGTLSFLLKKYPNLLTGVALTAASSFLFFLSTNFAVWAFSPWYEKSFTGLLYCYTLGLPFYRNMALGDALYTPLLFGVFAYGHIAAAYFAAARQKLALAFVTRV